MLSIDNLAEMFHSMNINSFQTPQTCHIEQPDPGYESDYDEGYDEGYAAGYAAAYAKITSEQQGNTFNIPNQVMQRGRKPPFGWKVVQNQLVQDQGEQIIIEAIRCLLRDHPCISLADICRELTRHRFTIRKSAKIYPTTIRNIINANNLHS